MNPKNDVIKFQLEDNCSAYFCSTLSRLIQIYDQKINGRSVCCAFHVWRSKSRSSCLDNFDHKQVKRVFIGLPGCSMMWRIPNEPPKLCADVFCNIRWTSNSKQRKLALMKARTVFTAVLDLCITLWKIHFSLWEPWSNLTPLTEVSQSLCSSNDKHKAKHKIMKFA